MFQVSGERMTKELTTLAPSTMKTKDELPDGNIISVGDERFFYVEVLFQPNFIEGASGFHDIPFRSVPLTSAMKCTPCRAIYGTTMFQGIGA